jgi:hypothetical protein
VLNLRRFVLLMLLMFLMPLALPASRVGAQGVRDAEMLSGHWHLVFHGKCIMNSDNLRACRSLQGPATFAVMNVRGATLDVTGIGDYTSNRTGHYSVRFTTWISEHVPHAGASLHCDNTTVFLGTFTGTCREQGTGHGHIGMGITGMPDFWQDDAQGTWNGTPASRFATGGPTDTFNPACPGTYNAARFLRLFGFSAVPAGISARVVLTHRP